MSEFVPPKKIFVDAKTYIEAIISTNFEKDLLENEEICAYCQGTGIVESNNIFGLSDDPDKKVGRFPYKHQSLTFCPQCYNGIVRRCEYCGNLLPKGHLICNCETVQSMRKAEQDQKEIELMEKAEAHDPSALGTVFATCYSEHYPHNEGYFNSWEEFFDSWEENGDRPEYVWGTTEQTISIDADSIIENATDDLYEEAGNDISDEKRRELQELLNKWCDDCGAGNTYYQSTKHKVRVPWEDYMK